MRLSFRVFGVIVLTAATAACDERLSDLAGPTPNLEPTFASIQREIFETTDTAGRTACVSCHNPSNPFAGRLLNLTASASYDQLVNRSSLQRPGRLLVSPGNPGGSYLLDKILGRAGIVGSRMPLNGPPYLTPGQVQILSRWIEIGAPR
jgi:hypothetical protein